MTLYKVLNSGESCHGGSGVWRKNRWRSVRGELVPCENGLHLCRRQELVRWLGPEIWVAEHDGELVESDRKVVARRARVTARMDTWNDRTARLFAADCAEHVLHLFENKYPGDDRPRLAIQATRDYANGTIRAASWAAAGAAAWDAAGDAARVAAWDAAGDAARAAAWDAAGDAARAAVWGAAGAAAWGAAGGAAGAAAGAAAWAAEREWQTTRLFDYLEGRAP